MYVYELPLVMEENRNYSLHSFILETNISYPLIGIRTCAYQGVNNVSFSESSAYIVNK